MIARVFNNGRVIWQQRLDGENVPDAAILAHIDNRDSIVLEQEDRQIVIEPDSIAELVRVLWELKKIVTMPVKGRA